MNHSKYLMRVFGVTLAIAILAGCNLAVVPSGPQPAAPMPPEIQPGGPQPPNLQPGGPIPPGLTPNGPQPGEPLNIRPAEVQITFSADRTTLSSGQCAQLQWAVQGGFARFLNGQPVEPSGQQQVCPTSTTTYRLEVDAGDQMLVREVVITVPGSSGEQQQDIVTVTPTRNKSGGSGIVITRTSTIPPKKITTVLPVLLITIDLAVMDVHESSSRVIAFTVKNVGIVDVNDNIDMECSGYISEGDIPISWEETDYPVNLKVGANVEILTNESIDSTKQDIHATCSISVPGDNNSNNDYGRFTD